MCPVAGCGRSLNPGHLMCRSHWFSVPPVLRARVWRTWRALEADFTDTDKHAAYQAARDEAIASV